MWLLLCRFGKPSRLHVQLLQPLQHAARQKLRQQQLLLSHVVSAAKQRQQQR
jgi:hypothetical protein